MRTEYDLEMLQEMGFCNGIENYSRHLSGRPPGSKPYTIIDFFPKDFLVVIDESHATIPQIGGCMKATARARPSLVNYGFRLPSALDNRPLNFDEFMKLTNQLVYVSATPAEFEIQNSVAGNKGYIPHRRQRIGEAELVPFAVAGEKRSTPINREQALNSISRGARPTFKVQFRSSGFAYGRARRKNSTCTRRVRSSLSSRSSALLGFSIRKSR